MTTPLLDATGRLLCQVETRITGDGLVQLYPPPAGQHALFCQYFRSRDHAVVLSVGDLYIWGDLATTWCGCERGWWLVPRGPRNRDTNEIDS